MRYFVSEDSIVREIWGKGDTILFIFAGASAEFALNKAVDWLYFTGKLPEDPLGRLFSTVNYARLIVFATDEKACKAIDTMSSIHSTVENNRGTKIPDWAYRDVLFMLIHYSIASFELLERKLNLSEKQEVFDVFYRVGQRMNINGLPKNFNEWMIMRQEHLQNHLQKSKYTTDLFRQYKKNLGLVRFALLREAQLLVVPQTVREMLQMGKVYFLKPLLIVYKLIRNIRMDWYLKSLILPAAYKQQIKDLDIKKPQLATK